MTSARTTLQLPSFLHGSYRTIQNETRAEGQRCGQVFLRQGILPLPEDLRAVAPGDVVLTHNLVDFDLEQPAWRLYMVSELVSSVCDTDAKNHRRLTTLYESSVQRAPWGALYFALSSYAPQSAPRMALRVGAVLESWPSLQHARYAHKTLGVSLSLEELLSATLGWVVDAWSPETLGPLPSRLALATERMAHATRAESTEVILRGLPRILALADRERLQHPEVVTHIAAWREHLPTLDASVFDRISAVSPGEVLRVMYQWDRQLHVQ